jgi:hypothetical protein
MERTIGQRIVVNMLPSAQMLTGSRHTHRIPKGRKRGKFNSLRPA